ncbi:hypothetical protein CL3_18330 [butyrate-producing bacterium SM4/1]|nr:hypothetical protein CL3_18330 [butyrate-producing bacterium SM4/1]
MENSLLNNLAFDPAFLIIGLAVLTLVCMIITLVCSTQYRKLYRRYDIFMRGKDAETLEDTILDLLDETAVLQTSDRESRDQLKSLTRQVRASYQKIGIVKYNAFKGMGGNLSFVIALLDDNNSGFILNSVHSREGCYLYMKDVEKGSTDVLLGAEEKEALEMALGY